MLKIFYRYLLKEIFELFLLILAIFIFVLLMGRILDLVEMIVAHGVSLWNLLQMVGFLLPLVLPYAIPMATLIAGVICFSRLTGDREIIALKASGVSIYQLLPPVAVFATFSCLFTLSLTWYWTPFGSFAFRKMAFELAKENLSVAFKEGVFNEVFPGFVVYADSISAKEGVMKGIFIQDEKSADVPVQILARSGSFNTPESADAPLVLRLENGSIYQVSPKDVRVRRVRFEKYELNIDLALSGIGEKLNRTRRKDLSSAALLKKIEKMNQRGRSADVLLLELHRRLAIPMASLIFGFLALPLALQSLPQQRSHGFLLGILVLILYYLMYSAGKIVAETKIAPVWACVWAPSVLMGLLTLVVLVRTAREKPSHILVLINSCINAVERWSKKRLGTGNASEDPRTSG
jgi:lipopolysaccharide export system permease protein